MINFRILAAAAFAAAGLLAFQPPAMAQQDWFVPGQQRVPGGAPRPATPPGGPRVPRPAPEPQRGSAGGPTGGPGGFQSQGDEQEQLPQLQVELPPAPAVPSLPRAPSPPAIVAGLISVPDIMRASTAAQEIERVIGERRRKLNEDAQKEQASWRDFQQQVGAQRGNVTQDQLRIKERDLQERITTAQRKFRDRNRVIQEALQYSLAQIERTLAGVLQQVAASHGMNMVLHRAQVALNTPEFDVSQEVVDQLNRILPAVVIPPDGVSPAQMHPVAAAPVPAPAAPAPAAAAAPPAPVPAAPTPAKPKP